jgi:hypothetical protein
MAPRYEEIAATTPKLVSALYDATKAQLSEEAARQGRLDAKATSMLGAIALSLTVSFTFGGLLLQNRKAFDPAIVATLAAFAGCVVCGLTAAWQALVVLKTREHLTTSAEALFAEALLDGGDASATDEVRLMDWQKAVIRHLWKIVERQRGIHAEKATALQTGQRFFFGFLIAVILLAVSAGFAALTKDHEGEPKPRPAASARS